MNTRKPILIILVLFALLLAASPTAAGTIPTKTAVKGTDTFLYDIYSGDETITPEGIYQIRDGISVGRWDTNDPRLTGEYTFTFNADFQFMPEPVFVSGYMWGTFKMETAGGYWEGTYSGTRDELGYSRFKFVATGKGGYSGLKLKMTYKRLDPDPSVPALISGAIIEP